MSAKGRLRVAVLGVASAVGVYQSAKRQRRNAPASGLFPAGWVERRRLLWRAASQRNHHSAAAHPSALRPNASHVLVYRPHTSHSPVYPPRSIMSEQSAKAGDPLASKSTAWSGRFDEPVADFVLRYGIGRLRSQAGVRRHRRLACARGDAARVRHHRRCRFGGYRARTAADSARKSNAISSSGASNWKTFT